MHTTYNAYVYTQVDVPELERKTTRSATTSDSDNSRDKTVRLYLTWLPNILGTCTYKHTHISYMSYGMYVMYVCMYACMHACMHTYIRTYIQVLATSSVHAYIHEFVHVCI